MIKSLTFKNYRVLRDAKLELGPCTLLLGPNGSGKSTAIAALRLFALAAKIQKNPINRPKDHLDASDVSLGASSGSKAEVVADWSKESLQVDVRLRWASGDGFGNPVGTTIRDWMQGIRIFSLDPEKIAKPTRWESPAEIQPDGSNLAVVLTQLQDRHFERFEALNHELAQCLPEFDRILFDTTFNSERSLMLRTRVGKYPVHATDLSHGILFALCIMSLSYLPDPPSMVCLEEPDRGIHPRLLRYVHDAMVRLSEPSKPGETREPVQVLATTHSPYLLDLFRDHPQDVVMAEKTENGATFHRLTDMPHYEEIMDGASLGDAWYTGILGGVPVRP
jgi:predicted ATPase